MCLAAHLGSLHGDNVEDGSVYGEEHVQSALQVILLELVGQVGAVQSVVRADAVRGSSLGSHL
jgi:hypothetical protein